MASRFGATYTIEDAIEAIIIGRTETSYEIHNTSSEDWITIDEIAC